jgi:hypothetical protein
VLVAVASDGAGSARYSAIGSWITSRVFARSAATFIRRGDGVSRLSKDTINEWLDDIRDQITVVASRRDAAPRDFAATLVGSLVGREHAVFLHIGDGGSVFRSGNADVWNIGTWPFQGEYASTTHFVTDDPAPACQFIIIEGPITELAVFSDGIERLVLDFSTRSAFAPFFDKVFAPLCGSDRGRNRKLSRDLQRFLDSPHICEKTDDDKTLILAKRILTV